MKLNPDCVRDLLLYVEAQPPGAEITLSVALPAPLSRYSFPEIEYHAKQCDLSGYLIGCRPNILGEIKVVGLSPSGHQFLENVRPDTVWEKTKSTAAKVGSFSLDFLSKVAASVTAELIKRQIG